MFKNGELPGLRIPVVEDRVTVLVADLRMRIMENSSISSEDRNMPVQDWSREHVAVGAPLPEMPLFLSTDRYIYVPLEPTYLDAFRGVPAFWHEILAETSD